MRRATLVFLLMTIAAAAVASSRPGSARAGVKFISVAVMRFQLDVGRPPTVGENLRALAEAPAGLSGWRGPYLADVPLMDPWNHAYVYWRSAEDGHVGFLVYSTGPNGIDESGAGDDITPWTEVDLSDSGPGEQFVTVLFIGVFGIGVLTLLYLAFQLTKRAARHVA